MAGVEHRITRFHSIFISVVTVTSTKVEMK